MMHNTATSYVVLFSIGLLVFYWRSYMTLKEHVMTHCQRLCQQHDCDLLDDTIALQRTQLTFANGRPLITRHFEFDYTSAQHERQTGSITCTNRHITSHHWQKQTTPATVIPFPKQ